jgi:hypothetical protein
MNNSSFVPVHVDCSNNASTLATCNINGWVDSPNGRGTFDIIQSSVATVFLCTYTVLFLNIHPGYRSRLAYFMHKTKWVIFTIFCAEFTLSIAAEQWRSAKQSVEDFTKLQKRLRQLIEQDRQPRDSHHKDLLAKLEEYPWTSRHAFFADMGGIRLQCPDFKSIPINAYQFFYLVEKGHIEYPCIGEKTIWDKNKADTFARSVALVQITWFTVQSIARGIQHLGLTTLELLTLAFAFCTLHTIYFWKNKPLDVEEPIKLVSNKRLGDIIVDVQKELGPQYCTRQRYECTPLDFIMPPPTLSAVNPFFWGIKLAFGQEKKVPVLPLTSFENIETLAPRGLGTADKIWGMSFVLMYMAIHLAAWDFRFPTATEHLLWRICALSMAINSLTYILCCWPIPQLFFKDHANALVLLKILPKGLIRSFMWLMIATYFPSRLYIIVEAFVSLRSQPVNIYASVTWWSFVPHL